MPEKIKIIQIAWKKIKYSKENISTLYEEYDYGIYQIYGSHPVYGEHTLLYIGKASKQTFSERLKDRTEFNETVLRPDSIHIGRIFKTEDTKTAHTNPTDWEDLIDITEKILIKAHSPAYNSQDIKGLFWKDTEQHYIIKNWYEYGLLLPEISSMNVSYRYWNEFGNDERYLGDTKKEEK